MTVIADENVSHEFITNLRHLGFDVLSIRESHRSSRDQYIIEVVRRYKGVLLTEDKDFGE